MKTTLQICTENGWPHLQILAKQIRKIQNDARDSAFREAAEYTNQSYPRRAAAMPNDIPPRIVNADGSIKHIIKDGARYHVVWWDSEGSHCSDPDCEINRRRVSPNAPHEPCGAKNENRES